MALKAFPTINTSDYELEKVQGNLSAFFQQFVGLPILDGQLITGVVLTIGIDNKVAHKLGRKYRGWMLTSISAAATVYENTSASNQGTYLTLHPSAAVTVSLWVF